MNRLIIEGVEADLKSDERIKLTRQVNDLREVKNKRTDFTNQFTLPYTPTNNKIFEHVRIYSSTSTTPYRYLDCQLLLNGYPVTIEGKIVLDKTDKRGYRVTVYAGLFNLFDELKNKKLSELDLSEYSHELTLSEVTTRNTNKTDVFYPVYNDGYGIDGNFFIRQKMPFIKNDIAIKKLFENIDFSLSGNFLSSDILLKSATFLNPPIERNIKFKVENSIAQRSTDAGLLVVSQTEIQENTGYLSSQDNKEIRDLDNINTVISTVDNYYNFPQFNTSEQNVVRVSFDGMTIKTDDTNNFYDLRDIFISFIQEDSGYSFFDLDDTDSLNQYKNGLVRTAPSISSLSIINNSNEVVEPVSTVKNISCIRVASDQFLGVNGFILSHGFTLVSHTDVGVKEIKFPNYIDVILENNNPLKLLVLVTSKPATFIPIIEVTEGVINYSIGGEFSQQAAKAPTINGGLNQSDYLKANLQLTNSFVSNIDYITKEVEITTLDSVASNTPYNWSNKLTQKGQTLIKYETNKVGQESYFKYDNEDNETIGENILNISNTRLDAEKDIIESDIKAVNQSSITLDSQSFTVDTIYTFEDKEEVNDNLIEEGNLTGQDLIDHQNEYRTETNTDDLFITYFEDQTGSITYEDDLNNTSTQSSFPKTNFTKLHWSELNDQYYQTWKEIFDEYKEVEMYFNLTLKDVIDFDFKRPVYLDTELGASLFYMNKISNYIEGKPTKCTLIKI